MTTVVQQKNRIISVNQGAQNQASIVVRKNTGENITLNSLKNVDTTDLQDGYTLVYDTTTNTWVSQPVGAAEFELGNIDGGTY
jgi:ATP-dependent 26S proteasome regulatory subunit